jgi:hypothetical protein
MNINFKSKWKQSISIMMALSLWACSSSTEPEPILSVEEQTNAFASCSELVTDVDWAFAESRAKELNCYNQAQDSLKTLFFTYEQSYDKISMIAFTRDGEMVDFIENLRETSQTNVYSGELTNDQPQALLLCTRKVSGVVAVYGSEVGQYCPSVGEEYSIVQ